MSTTLEQVKATTLERLESLARRGGLSVDDYLLSLLPLDEMDLSLRADAADDEFESDMATFTDETDHSNGYKGTYSREDIYFDHD